MFNKVFDDYVHIGLDLLISAIVLFGVFSFMGLTSDYNEKQLEQQVVAQEIQEQRHNLFYNNTYVYAQDVVAQVLRYKGDKTVLVEVRDNHDALLNTYEWGPNTASTQYKVSAVSTVIPTDLLYHADLIYGPNGAEVVGYKFVGKAGD